MNQEKRATCTPFVAPKRAVPASSFRVDSKDSLACQLSASGNQCRVLARARRSACRGRLARHLVASCRAPGRGEAPDRRRLPPSMASGLSTSELGLILRELLQAGADLKLTMFGGRQCQAETRSGCVLFVVLGARKPSVSQWLAAVSGAPSGERATRACQAKRDCQRRRHEAARRCMRRRLVVVVH